MDNKIEFKDIEFKLLFDRTGDMISILSLVTEPKWIYLNNASKKILGYDSNELIGSSPFKYIHPENKAEMLKLLKETLSLQAQKIKSPKADEPISLSYRFKKKDGTWAHIESTVDVVDDKIFVVSRDISRERKYIEEVEAERKNAENYLNITGSLIVALDKKGNVTLVNDTGSEMLGVPKSEVLGKNWIENFVAKEERKALKKILGDILKDEKSFEVNENYIVGKDGDKKLIKWHNTILKDEKGRVAGTLSSGVDVTEMRRQEKIILESAREWAETFDSMSDGVTVYDSEFNIINANNEVCRLLGKEKKEIIGKKCFFIFKKAGSTATLCPLARSKETKKREMYEYYDDNLKKWLSIIISPVLEGKKITKYIHIVRDISEQKEVERANAARQEELMRFNKLAIGRELKMIELKKEILALKKGKMESSEAGNPEIGN